MDHNNLTYFTWLLHSNCKQNISPIFCGFPRKLKLYCIFSMISISGQIKILLPCFLWVLEKTRSQSKNICEKSRLIYGYFRWCSVFCLIANCLPKTRLPPGACSKWHSLFQIIDPIIAAETLEPVKNWNFRSRLIKKHNLYYIFYCDSKE